MIVKLIIILLATLVLALLVRKVSNPQERHVFSLIKERTIQYLNNIYVLVAITILGTVAYFVIGVYIRMEYDNFFTKHYHTIILGLVGILLTWRHIKRNRKKEEEEQ